MTWHLNYPFVNYDFPLDDGGAAQAHFIANFDRHVGLQDLRLFFLLLYMRYLMFATGLSIDF